ncbi:phage major capsid protein [Bacillus cereus]|nr:phage major capsid protein [Bacillus cereus]MEB9569674.1 phage major capsid protein [Bacillus cereus]
MTVQDPETKFLNKEQLGQILMSGSQEEIDNAMIEFAAGIEQQVIQMATTKQNDQAVLAARGGYALTNEELTFFNKVIDANGFDGVEELVPATLIERVFEDLTYNHELLNEILFVNVNGLSSWTVKKGEIQTAFWGKLSSAHKELLDEGFEQIPVNQLKLSAFLPVSKAMLDLGPNWLDRYVRTALVESLAIALEAAIVAGTGKDMPIGMIKDLDNVTNGEHADKPKTKMERFTPKTLGEQVMSPLCKDGKRTPQNVLLIVNPLDYWSKIFPSTTFLTAQGTYVFNVLPIPGKVIQSVAVPVGTMVAGMAKDYFMGLGGSQKIESYDQTRAIEDEQLYIARMYANGRAKENESFLVFDISEMEVIEPTPPTEPAGQTKAKK